MIYNIPLNRSARPNFKKILVKSPEGMKVVWFSVFLDADPKSPCHIRCRPAAATSESSETSVGIATTDLTDVTRLNFFEVARAASFFSKY